MYVEIKRFDNIPPSSALLHLGLIHDILIPISIGPAYTKEPEVKP